MSGGEVATILLVDDDKSVRAVLRALLTRAGYRVREAATGGEALSQTITMPDLVVLDIGLPDIDGFEVCRIMRTDPRLGRIPVIMVSGTFTGLEHKIQSLELGADAYLAHPIESVELVATIKALLRMHRAEESLIEAEKRDQTLEVRRLRRQASGHVRHETELEETLVATEARYRTVFESAGHGIIMADREVRVVDVNPAFLALTGHARQELAPESPLSSVIRLEEGAADIRRLFDSVERVDDVRASLVRRDGTTVAVRLTAAALRDPDGQINLTVWMLQPDA